ncbi:MAG TPA: hypothetical protein VEK34_16820 [Methylocella sp.]|nr:hypothetical protein [Methylocella sp.]
MIFFATVLALICLVFGGSAWAEPARERTCFSAAESRDKITVHGLSEPFHAMRSAAARLQAEALAVKLCRWSEQLVYDLSLLRHDGRLIHVFLDAKTGQAIGLKNELDRVGGPVGAAEPAR